MTLFRVTQRMVVNGILSEFGHDEDYDWSTHRAPMFTIKNDHAGEVCTNASLSQCGGCDCLHPRCFSGYMTWRKDLPIIRFTSEGLQISGEFAE